MFSKTRPMKAAAIRARSDFSPSSKLRVCLRRDDLPVMAQRAGQPIEASAAINRGEPAGGPCGSSGACPAQEAVFLQAGDVRGFLPQAGIQVAVGCHFTLLSVWWLKALTRASSPKPCRRLQMGAVAQSRRRRHFSGSAPAAPASAPRIRRVLVDGDGLPRWGPVQTDTQRRMARFHRIACPRCQRPPGPAERWRAWRTGRRRGSAR